LTTTQAGLFYDSFNYMLKKWEVNQTEFNLHSYEYQWAIGSFLTNSLGLTQVTITPIYLDALKKYSGMFKKEISLW